MPSIERPQHIEAQDPRFITFRRKTINQWFIWALVSLVGLIFLGGIGFFVAILAMSWVLLQTILSLYHRTQVENFLHYRQLEALASLHALIKVRQPLPPLRLWAISPDFALLITSTIRQYRPAHIVELGSGTSTLISSYALEEIGSGKVTSYEHLAQFAQISQRDLEKHGLKKLATVIHAPLKTWGKDEQSWQWYALENVTSEKIDLLIVDGPPENTNKLARYPAVPALYDRLNDGAIILVDDVMRPDETDMVNRWLAEFDLEVLEVLANEKGAAILRKTAAPSSPV